jgi:signal transduction histidine kinase
MKNYFHKYYLLFLFTTVFLLFYKTSSSQQKLSGDDKEQLNYFRETIREELDSDRYRSAAEYMNKAGYFFWNHDLLDSAKTYFSRSLKINQKFKNYNGLKTIHYNLGLIESDRENYQKSLQNFSKGLGYAERLNQEKSIVDGLLNKAIVFQEIGQYDRSVKIAKKALLKAKELKDFENIKSAYGIVSEGYKGMNQSEQAMLYFDSLNAIKKHLQDKQVEKIHTHYKDTISKVETQKKQKESQLKHTSERLRVTKDSLFQTEKLNKEQRMRLEIKELELARKEMQLKQDKLIKIFLSALLVLSAVFAIILYRQNRKLKEAYIKLEEKNNRISEQRDKIEQQRNKVEQQNRQLSESEKQLKISNATKDKFFSIIAHDLKNPFQALYSLTQHINKNIERYNKKDLEEKLNVIHHSADQLLKLLENLLHWSRSQRGKMNFNKREIILSDLVNQNIELLKMNAEKKRIDLAFEVDENLIVKADYDSINTVLRNLISNAIKYTENGSVRVFTETMNNNKVKVAVSDTGVGMTREEKEKLFKVDQNFSTKGTQNEEGTGLGLILCKEFVNKHNEEIWVESKKGEGSTFCFTLSKI